MSDPVEELYDAADGNCVSEVSSLLKDHPDINVNWTNAAEWTALHIASLSGHAEVVKVLLAHPNINVNLRNSNGQTPCSLACEFGRGLVVELLLKDPRVDVTLDDDLGCTPLWWASSYGKQEVIEWFIASGRVLGDIKSQKEYTALEIARREKKTEVVSLLESFIANPVLIRQKVRVKLGVLNALAAEVFALTVFLCDDLLQL